VDNNSTWSDYLPAVHEIRTCSAKVKKKKTKAFVSGFILVALLVRFYTKHFSFYVVLVLKII